MATSLHDSAAKDTKCSKCKSRFQPDAAAVGCDYCSNWFHLQCTKVSKALFAELKKAEGTDSVKWKCDQCASSNTDNSESQSINNFKKDFMTLFNAFDAKITKKLENLEDNITTKLEKHKKEVDDQFNDVYTRQLLSNR